MGRIKGLYFLIAICFLATRIYAQQGIVFKVKYLPKNYYSVDAASELNMEMNFVGSEEVIKKLEAKGLKTPLIIKTDVTNKIHVVTEAAQRDGLFNMAIGLDKGESKSMMGGQLISSTDDALVGDKITAEYNTINDIKLLSINDRDISATEKEQIGKLMSKVEDIRFPERALKPGDTFVQENPFNMPGQGLNVEFTLKDTYKLTSIKDGIANFDFDRSVDLHMQTKQDTATVTIICKGEGKGKVIYDIKRSFPTAISSNLDITYQALTNNITVNSKMKLNNTEQIVITAIDGAPPTVKELKVR